MSPEEAFLQAVIESPDDDGPRLMFADWLDERGESGRAEFIRVQIDRARLPDDDPRQSELEARELRLLHEHAPAWRPDNPLASVVRFDRGFIDDVAADADDILRHGPDLFRVAPIRR